MASLGPVVARFFDDVMVMAEDEALRTARLQLVANLRDVILGIADLSEMAASSSVNAQFTIHESAGTAVDP